MVLIMDIIQIVTGREWSKSSTIEEWALLGCQRQMTKRSKRISRNIELIRDTSYLLQLTREIYVKKQFTLQRTYEESAWKTAYFSKVKGKSILIAFRYEERKNDYRQGQQKDPPKSEAFL